MPEQDMPIFTRTFDLISWLLPATNHFPKAHRHTLTRQLLDAAFDLRERLEEAHIHRGGERVAQLQQADAALARVRVYIRLTFQSVRQGIPFLGFLVYPT